MQRGLAHSPKITEQPGLVQRPFLLLSPRGPPLVTTSRSTAPYTAAIWVLDVWTALEWGWAGITLPMHAPLVAEIHRLGGQG